VGLECEGAETVKEMVIDQLLRGGFYKKQWGCGSLGPEKVVVVGFDTCWPGRDGQGWTVFWPIIDF
jgi:hypothetical protein